MKQAIFTIVDKGRAENVVEAAEKAGAKGGTIINARGSNPQENGMLFSMSIEPEKEIVLILAENEITEAIITAIREYTNENYTLFAMGTSQTYGMY